MTTNVKFPEVDVPILSGTNPIENSAQQVLFVGQKSSAGSASAGLVENISARSNEIAALVGGNSYLYQMLNDGRELNSLVQYDALIQEDNGSNYWNRPFTYSGTATADGTVQVIVGSSEKFTIDVSVLEGDTAADVASAVNTAIGNVADKPFTSGVSTATVTLTAVNAGTVMNSTGLIATSSTAGISVSLGSATLGSTDPVLTNIFDAIGDNRYQTIVWPYATTAQIQIVKDHLDSVFNAQGEASDGVAIVTSQDTFANLISLGTPENSQSLVILSGERGAGTEYPDVFEFDFCISAQAGAIRALRRQDGANIAQYVITRGGALDSIGGPALSSRPYANTPMPLLPLSETGRGFDKLEIAQLKEAGVSVIGNNKANNGVIMGEIVTTYKTDAAGNPDDTFKFLNYVDTASTGREYILNNLEADYAQSRLTDGDLEKGRSMANAESIYAIIVGYFQILGGSDYVVARKGPEALAFFKENLSVEIDLASGTATCPMELPIVTQLRKINAPMTLTFNIQ